MQVIEFLRTIGCTRRDRVTVSLTEHMIPQAEFTLAEFDREFRHHTYDERAVRTISPSAGMGGLFIVVEMFPTESIKKEGLPHTPTTAR